MTYADSVCDWLVAEGYTHCFFVAGGNIMHLLNSARTRFECVPFVHEVAAGIAAEYFNEARPNEETRAFALVTAGPGLTNIVTAMAGAYLESRELLIIGGQVKTSDMSRGRIRQRGIQEVDGVAIASPVCKKSVLLDRPWPKDDFLELVRSTSGDRPGPVFLEMCLDVQGQIFTGADGPTVGGAPVAPNLAKETSNIRAHEFAEAVTALSKAQRPLLLLGGGVSRASAPRIMELARKAKIPCATTWNGADRVDAQDPLYAGRPNTWGMRWANLVLQQADVLLAVGTRLGLQQTGFNWQEFVPVGRVIQIDIDEMELLKGHPHVDIPIHGDASACAPDLIAQASEQTEQECLAKRDDWLAFIHRVREELPLADPCNETRAGYLDPYRFLEELSSTLSADAVIIPCSSGGAFTVTMQALVNKRGQTIVTDKGLASMGYGLSGAIGAALANPDRRTVLIEGDGGFSQNLQELGTVARQGLDVKIFLFSNEGYASIRMTQRNYFDGAYVGCDVATGLGMPNWLALFSAYGIPAIELSSRRGMDETVLSLLNARGPAAFVVPIDPEQTYFPKISSRITPDGSMESSPLHLMTPALDSATTAKVMPFLRLEEGVRE